MGLEAYTASATEAAAYLVCTHARVQFTIARLAALPLLITACTPLLAYLNVWSGWHELVAGDMAWLLDQLG
eukprot:9747748-Alexandrium_andersonii.AAC.1